MGSGTAGNLAADAIKAGWARLTNRRGGGSNGGGDGEVQALRAEVQGLRADVQHHRTLQFLLTVHMCNVEARHQAEAAKWAMEKAHLEESVEILAQKQSVQNQPAASANNAD